MYSDNRSRGSRSPGSTRRRDRDQIRDTNQALGADFDIDAFKRDLMDKFVDDTTAIAQE